VPFFGRGNDADDDCGFWAGAARLVMGHPVPALAGALALLLALATPLLSEKLGAGGAETFPHSSASYRAFQILDGEFSIGRSAPTQIVIQAQDVHSPQVVAAITRLQSAIAGDGQIKLLQSAGDGPTADGAIDVVTVTLPGSLTSQTALEALQRLRKEIVPTALRGSGARAYMSGQTAGNADFFALVDRYTPVVFAFVLSLSFFLLLLVFRSIVVPLKAILMNVLSVGAAYGVLVLVFQRGLGAHLLGLQRAPVIEAWIPLFLFAILFGLSMDYHVFLLSRIREHYDQTSDNAGSVAYGLRSTANIITGAAAIMVVVFGGFALGDLASFQQMGFGLAVAVLLDATVVRMVLVPSAMELLGDRNWYLPSWLHWLWDLRVEGRLAPDKRPSAPRPRLTASGDQR
jgi:RND superfamily putative drug exporter